MALRKLISKLNPKISTFLLVLSLFFIFYSSRQVFFYRYEPEYYENWYYNSQWNVPQSTRGISDGELYKFVGYRLTEGENPFNINYEVPPFAKYLYGLAERYFQNPYYVSIILYFFCLLVLFLFSKLLFKKEINPILPVLLFVVSPFVSTQIKETMLDLPLMAMFLFHLYFFIRYLSSRDKKFILLSGIFLGLATGTKIGIYTIPLVFLTSALIFFPRKLLFELFLHNLSIFGGYILAFISYFLKHPNPLPWLRLHEKVLGFYLQNKPSSFDHLSQWRGIFFNNYQGFWEGALKTGLGDWSPLLPIGVIFSVIILFLSLKKKDKKWFYISLFSLTFLCINTLVPFFPRYLMPCIPVFAILTAYLFQKKPNFILLLCLLSLPFLINSFPFPKVEGDSQAFARFFSTRAYRELYRSLDPLQRKEIPEKYFIEEMEYFFDTLNIRKTEFQTVNISSDNDNKETLVVSKIIHETKYGLLENNISVEYIKRNNQWKTVWKWDYLWPEYDPDFEIIISEKDLPLERIVLNNQVIAYKDQGQAVYIIPRLMFDWVKSVEVLSKLTAQPQEDVNRIVRRNIPDDYPRFIGYLDPDLNNQDPHTKYLLEYPGISLKSNLYFRIDPQVKNGALVSQILIDLQKQHPEYFYTKADIYLKKDDNQKINLPLQTTDQENIVLLL